MNAVSIFDTTLRDGDQTPGVHFDSKQKVAIAERLAAMGVDTIEAGFPASSPGDRDAVKAVAAAVGDGEVAALARCKVEDVDAAGEALSGAARPVIHLVIAVSDLHIAKKFGGSRARVVQAIEESVARALRYGTVQFSAEDATRADPIFLRQCVTAAVHAGATRINIPDTVGCAMPGEYAAIIRDIVRWAGPAVVVSAHCHNDLGMATANTLAAVAAGARQVEVTVNGIGERAGNAALEEVVTAMTLKGVARHGVDTAQLTAISRMVAEASGVAVQPHKAVVGANAFAHSSGIHQDGVAKDPATYGFVPPEMVGAPGHVFRLTARSGRTGLVRAAADWGIAVAADDIDRVYAAFIAAADTCPGEITRERFEAIMAAGEGG